MNICENILSSEKDVCVLEGGLSVRAAVVSSKRKIYAVLIDFRKKQKRDRKTLALISFLESAGINYTLADRAYIEDTLAKLSRGSASNTHGGVIALVSSRVYENFSELLSNPAAGDYYVYLDGIEDPFNLGYSIRTLYAMGCAGILLPKRSWHNADGIISRASAGASELCKIAEMPEDDLQTALFLKENGWKIVCSALAHDSVPISDFKPSEPFILFIGGEKRGISPEFYDNADVKVHIPYARNEVKYSLPTASVCAFFASALSDYVLSAENKLAE